MSSATYISLLSLFICFNQVLTDCSNVVIISDFDPSSCDRQKNEYYTDSLHDTCIPGCVIKKGIGEECHDNSECAPGLHCDSVEYNCQEDPDSETRCFLQKNTISWTPNCLPDGYFAPKQCKGEAPNGRCYCFDKKGKRIYGEEWSNKAENMTCACSRMRSELEKERTDVTIHCDSMGNFEPLQCDSGSCWCADPKTGEVLVTVVPEEMMTILPCYNKTEIGEQYLRQCESLQLAQNKIKSEFSTHGTNNILLSFVQCDFDGGYGRVKVNKNIVNCAWRDGTNIYSYATQQNLLNTVNCNCARDSKIYELSGKAMTKMCTGNGNYELLQVYDDKQNFCIDYDGFITYGPTNIENAEECLQHLP